MARKIDTRRYETHDPLYEQDSIADRSRNKDLLRGLLGKTVSFSTNRMAGQKVTFPVQHVEEMTVTIGNAPVNCVRLYSRQFGKADHPTVQVPSLPIEVETEGNQTRLVLMYPKEINIKRDFERMHRESKPDLEIYIEYEI